MGAEIFHINIFFFFYWGKNFLVSSISHKSELEPCMNCIDPFKSTLQFSESYNTAIILLTNTLSEGFICICI